MRKIFFALLIVLGISSFSISTVVEAESTTNIKTANNIYHIKIDGKFSDWDDTHKTDIGYDWDKIIKQGVLLADDKNMYMYINMSKNNNGDAPLQENTYKFTIANKEYNVDFRSVAGMKNNETKNVRVDVWGPTYNGAVKSADAKVHRTIKNGHIHDILETRIPFAGIKAPVAASQDITMYATNLGPQKLKVTGGSTGPVVLAIIGFAIALFAVIKVPKMRKARKVINK
ncbi:Firmicu-CTERM sorting domain-containing protein [Companilactobacillus kimchiensis]|uniref:Firmicu-CTERM sorting domain-containing protein n=1 Tax=Companilactobacillus kimchiensis TaxID=993692 RepID=A0A0R2LDS8_9LACO|nr:Firmicu-CTERM sorting domain-containing protein [Companilactobacillus kimchiensis]KRO00088.1 hypothetical protein IV57_GL002104 [Companilactobacillus kimchiensis]